MSDVYKYEKASAVIRSKKVQAFFGDLELNKFQGQQQDMLQWNTAGGTLKIF
jgi:hypothetical protein